MDCRDSALPYWAPLSHASHGIPFTTCKLPYQKQVALPHVSANTSMSHMCHPTSSHVMNDNNAIIHNHVDNSINIMLNNLVQNFEF